MSKKGGPSGEELLASLDELGIVSPEPTTKPSAGGSTADPDLLEKELGLPERAKTSSRPHTPRVGSTSTASATKSSPKRSGAATPPSNDGTRSSEEKLHLRKSGESSRSFHNSFTPASTEAESPPEKTSNAISEAEPQPKTSGGGWWGALSATASAAVKQAESLAKEIRQNEEAQRWAEQVKGNVGALRGFGGELRSRALPTFTNLLHTLAPPISSHERLQIHITHDLIGYPSLDPLIYATFSRVMAQVEGGDLMVIQRGQESRRGSEGGYTGSSNSGWSDGPWWRHASQARNLGAVKGLVEGTKLSKASAEGYANEYFAARGGVEEAAKQATQILNENNPIRSSDIFLAIQAISQADSSETAISSSPADKDPSSTPSQQTQPSIVAGAVDPPSDPDSTISFAVYLHDPIHGITFSTISQSLPEKWIHWLDASATSPDPASPNPNNPNENLGSDLPDEIAEIVLAGGVDPREWVAEWVEEIITLSVGIVAQRYVARRMGVGQGGIGRGKARQEALESGGGEAARVI